MQCLWLFHILFLLSYYCYCYCHNCYKTVTVVAVTIATVTTAIKTIILLCYWSLCCKYLISMCGWIDNSTANLTNILWLPLCRINKFGLNTLPSKTVAIPYTCVLSRLFSGAVAGEGRIKDVMQVLFHKHVWLYSEYMPTIHWWIGANSVSPYVMIVTWWTASGIFLHHRSNAYELFTYCSSLIYFSVATVTITTKPKNITFATVTSILLCY